MSTSQQPKAVVKRVENAPSIFDRKELAPLTAPEALAVIRGSLPRGVEVERVLSEVLLAMQQNPKLQECTPASLVQSVAKAVGQGLTIGEKAHLVPFAVKVARNPDRWEQRCQYVRDYKGDAELVINAGGARFIDAFNVFENELFEHEQGSEPFIRHRTLPPSKRGKLVGAYAVAVIAPSLPKKIVHLHREEIEEVKRKYSKQWNTKKKGNVDVEIPLEDVLWYGPKTCVHRVCKLLPTNPRMQKVMQSIEEELASFEVEDAPASATASVAQPPAPPAGEAPAPACAPDEADDQQDMRF